MVKLPEISDGEPVKVFAPPVDEKPVMIYSNAKLRCGITGPRTGKKYRFEPGKGLEVAQSDADVLIARGGWSKNKTK